MVNNTQIISISVPKLLVDFIEKAELSPSALFQEAAIEKRRLWNIFNADNAKLQSNILSLQEINAELITFLETNGITYEAYLGWRKDRPIKGHAIL
jgi:hypothetical protein